MARISRIPWSFSIIASSALRTAEAGPPRYRYFIGAGLFIGLGAYTYLAGRFVPVGLALFLLAEAALAGLGRQRPLLLRQWRGLLLAAGVAAQVFEPFVTTKPVGKGTGLGLDIVRRLVTHNDAEIEVESVPGRTEFRVALPVADSRSTKPS